MVNQWRGEWTEEKDYSTYPKEKWCDYDYMVVWIRGQKYEPKTSMENLISIFSCIMIVKLKKSQAVIIQRMETLKERILKLYRHMQLIQD